MDRDIKLSAYHITTPDGGYFIGRPMDPESSPVNIKKAKAESRFKPHGLGWRQADQDP